MKIMETEIMEGKAKQEESRVKQWEKMQKRNYVDTEGQYEGIMW